MHSVIPPRFGHESSIPSLRNSRSRPGRAWHCFQPSPREERAASTPDSAPFQSRFGSPNASRMTTGAVAAPFGPDG